MSNFFATPPGFSVHGISQARVLKWVAISFSNVTCISEGHSVVPDSLRTHGLYSPWNSPGQNTGVGSLSLLQGIFPTQGSNPGLTHCRQILFQLSHKGSLLYVYLHIFYAFMIDLFLTFSLFLGCKIHLQVFSSCHKSQKVFSIYLWKKNVH